MSRPAPPSIDEAVRVFSTEFQFQPETNTKRAYVAGLRAWLEFFRATGISPQEMCVDALEPNIVTLFSGWMLTAKRPLDKKRPQKSVPAQKSRRPPRFSPATRRLYQAALLRALDFWRSRGWISFYAEQESSMRSASGIRSHRPRTEKSQRAGLVSSDFGPRMLQAAFDLPLPAPEHRYDLLENLRTRVLICILASTGLRISDVCKLTRSDYTHARAAGGLFTVLMKKTGETAYPSFSHATMVTIVQYLSERRDESPFLLISHGRGPLTPHKSIERRTGYGETLSYGTAYKIVRDISAIAYPKPTARAFLGPHAFRHWFSQRLIDNDVPLEHVQSILGHSNPSTTKQTYTSHPNRDALIVSGHTLHDQMDPVIQEKS